MPIRILLADDHAMFRSGLRALLDRLPDALVVGEAGDGLETLALARELNPDLVIADVAMPNLNGIEMTRQLITESPEANVVILSMHSDRRFVLEALRAGARGYLLKESAFEELAFAIRAVQRKDVYLGSQIHGPVVRDYIAATANEPSSAFAVLSARERTVLQLLAEGQAAKDIAAQLKVSIKTVETHRKHLMDKLNIHSVAELTKYAIREGLTSVD